MSGFEELMRHAIRQARLGAAEGGIPIGAALVSGDRLLAVGRNRRVQKASPILHAEIDCLERAGRQPAAVYRRTTLFTTLSPCFLCAGAVLLYGIPRVVIGENRTFSTSEELLSSHGVQVVVLDLDACTELMQEFITAHPDLWNEDIGNDGG
ncbi:nucleoside deaminase [Streptomyces sp. KLOTTS4A1]|uniref:nucleoside deaminase n=1 Tax=Streptomyces sp. KLOTTS4A1 TaxID=3390996 RepID=UPI0039F5FA0A